MKRSTLLIAAGALAASLASVSEPARADDTIVDAAPAAGDSILSASVTLDYVNQYFFRGIVQETSGLIVQPGFELGFALFEGDGALSGVGLALGLWNSIHSGASGDAKLPTSPGNWYEADLYAGLAFDLAGGLTIGATYTLYASPNGTFAAVDELAFALAWDDSELYGEGARFGGIQPSLTLAVELDNTAFGAEEGVYGEVAIEPSYALVTDGAVTLGLSLPVALGLSLGDYYEAADDDTFGYVTAGLVATLGLAFIDARWGEWELSTGAKVLVLGDNLADAAGKSEVLLAQVGLAASY